MAVLDINLNGSTVFPLAEDLMVRGIPLVLLTGYTPANVPDAFHGLECVAKPYDLGELLDAMRRAAA